MLFRLSAKLDRVINQAQKSPRKWAFYKPDRLTFYVIAE